jgi:hypothetical protein
MSMDKLIYDPKNDYTAEVFHWNVKADCIELHVWGKIKHEYAAHYEALIHVSVNNIMTHPVYKEGFKTEAMATKKLIITGIRLTQARRFFHLDKKVKEAG